MTPTGFRGAFRTDDVARAVYAEAAGIGRIVPLAVAVPADADDLAVLVRWASQEGVALTARGSGSSMAGAAIGDGVIVDLSRLDVLGEVDVAERQVRAGPGVVRDAIDAAARRVGLRFPVDPSSGAFCTIGGMAATNAAGAHTMRFGATRPWIVALDCVFDDGSRAVVRRGTAAPLAVPAVARFTAGVDTLARVRGARAVHAGVRKDASGYGVAAYASSGDLVDLLAGSEGTLAFFVGVEIALAPLPGATASLLATFATLEDAVAGTAAARDATASACELLDRTFLDVAHGAPSFSIPGGTEAVLLIELEAHDTEQAASEARLLARQLGDAGARDVRLGLDAATSDALWAVRHAASPMLARLDPHLRSMQFIEDGAVPPDRLPEYVRGVRDALAAQRFRGVIFGHAGDAHMHANALIDVSESGWQDRVVALLDDVVALTARLGGTLSGEHGDGRIRAPLLPRVWSAESLDLFRRVKEAFDPRGILNPGVKVALAGQRAVGSIKYDPTLPPQPELARRALDAIERDRGYAQFRLGMVDRG